MKSRIFIAIAFFLSVSAAFCQNLNGTWKASLEKSVSDRNWPTGLYAGAPTTLTLKIEGSSIVGAARIEGWPGNAKVIDGKIDGENFSFSLLTENNSTDGPQTLYCTGIIRGDTIEFTMRWPAKQLDMKLRGKRAS